MPTIRFKLFCQCCRRRLIPTKPATPPPPMPKVIFAADISLFGVGPWTNPVAFSLYLSSSLTIVVVLRQFDTANLYTCIFSLNLETLEMRRIKFDLKLCYKIENELCDSNFDKLFTLLPLLSQEVIILNLLNPL